MATKTVNPGEKIVSDNTNLGEIKDTQDKTFETMSNDSLDLGNGLTLSKSDAKYQSLIGKGFSDEQIIKAVGKMSSPEKIEGVSKTETPINAPKEQVIPSPNEQIKPQEIKTEQTTIEDKKTPTLLSQSDYLDDSEVRQQQIISNLNQAIQTNPQSLKSLKDFRNYYNYAGRSDLQKQTLDTWYQGFSKGQDLSYKDTNDIYKSYEAGVINQADLNNLNLVNPTKYNEVKSIIDKKNKLNTYSQDLYGKKEEANPFQAIIDSYVNGLKALSGSNFYQEYKDAMNSAGIKEQKLNIADKQTEIDKIDRDINTKKSEIEKQYEGTGATRGKINAIIADELEDLYNLRSNLVIDMNGAINKYNAEAGAIKEDFEMKQAEYQFNMQQKQQQMSELGFAMQLMSYETPQQQDERAWNTFIRQQEYQDGNIYSNDPATRQRAITKAVDNVLTEFAGIPMVRSREQMVNDIKNLVEGGMDLGEAITQNIRNPIMQKPEYKKWVNDKFGIDTSKKLVKIGGADYLMDNDGNITLPVLPGTGIDLGFISAGDLSGLASQYPGEASFKNNNPAGLTWGVSNELKNLWTQAGISFEKGTARPSAEGNNYIKFNTIEDGLKAYDIAMTQRHGNSTVRTYLNTWGTGTVGLPENILNKKVKDLSAEEKKTVQNAQLKKESPGLYNYLQNQTGVSQIGQAQNISFNEELAPMYNKFNSGKSLTTADYKFISGLGVDEKQFVNQSLAYKNNEDQKMKPLAQELVGLIGKLEDISRVDLQNMRANTPGTDGRNLRNIYDRLIASTALQKLVDLKSQGATFGALSDNELNFITDASNNLDLWTKKGTLLDNLAEYKRILQKGINSISGQPTTTQTNNGYTFNIPTISGTGNTFTLSNGQSITW